MVKRRQDLSGGEEEQQTHRTVTAETAGAAPVTPATFIMNNTEVQHIVLPGKCFVSLNPSGIERIVLLPENQLRVVTKNGGNCHLGVFKDVLDKDDFLKECRHYNVIVDDSEL